MALDGIGMATGFILVLAFGLDIAAFATRAWYVDGGTEWGLWETCTDCDDDCVCDDANDHDDYDGWWKANQALQILGLVGFLCTCLVYLATICWDHFYSFRTWSTITAMCAAITGVAIVVGCGVWGANVDDSDDLGYSFYLAVGALVGAFIVSILCCMLRPQRTYICADLGLSGMTDGGDYRGRRPPMGRRRPPPYPGLKPRHPADYDIYPPRPYYPSPFNYRFY